MIPCNKAIDIFNKLKTDFQNIYPAGGLLLCLDNKILETRDVDIVSKHHTRFTKIVVDNVIIHIFPYNPIIHDECYNLDNNTTIYYCLKTKLFELSMKPAR